MTSFDQSTNITEAISSISPLVSLAKNATELHELIIQNLAFSVADLEFFTNAMRLGLAFNLIKNIKINAKNVFTNAYTLPIDDIEFLNKCADNALPLLFNEFKFTLKEIAKIAQVLTVEDLKELAGTRIFRVGKGLLELKRKTAHVPELSFVQHKNLTSLNPPFRMFSELLIALLDIKYSIYNTKNFITESLGKKGRNCDADLNNFEHGYLIDNADCFIKKIDFTYHFNYMFDMPRLTAVNSLITILNFDTRDAVEMVYNVLCVENCKLQVIPFAQINIVNEALVSILEANPALDIFQAQKIVVQLGMNITLPTNYSLANAPILFEQNQINYQHVGLLERKKLTATEILINKFDFMIREAFQQADNLSPSEIKVIIKTVPVNKVRLLKNLLLELLKSSPLRSCHTVEEALTQALNLTQAKQEISDMANLKISPYITPHRSIVYENQIQSWHLKKLLSKKADAILNEQAAIFAQQRQLSYGSNSAIVKYVHENMVTWQNLTTGLKFNCIEAKNNILNFTGQQIKDLPDIVKEDMPTFYAIVRGVMLKREILIVDNYPIFNQAANTAFTDFAITKARLAHWNVRQLLSEQAAEEILQDIRLQKEIQSTQFHNYLRMQEEERESMRTIRQPNMSLAMQIKANSSVNTLVFNPVFRMQINSTSQDGLAVRYDDSMRNANLIIIIFAVTALIGVGCRLLKPCRLIATKLYQGFSLFSQKENVKNPNFGTKRPTPLELIENGAVEEKVSLVPASKLPHIKRAR